MVREDTVRLRCLGVVVSVRGSADVALADCGAASVDDETRAADLQREGTAAFAKSCGMS